MIKVINDQIERRIDLAEGALLLRGAQLGIWIGGRDRGFGWTYKRPTSVANGSGQPQKVADHVMIARLMTLTVLLMAVTRRLLR